MSRSRAAQVRASVDSLASLDEFSEAAPQTYPATKGSAAASGKRRPGRPKSTDARMVPFASRVQEVKKTQLGQLAHSLGKTETALLDEALNLLFKRHRV
jgi:hypothetical protein